MIYKFIDEHTVQKWRGKYFVHEGMTYSNPTTEQLKMVGYKPLVELGAPEECEGYFAVPTYTENENNITVTYQYEQITDETEE